MASYQILLPHKKLKNSFTEFGGNFGGVLRDNLDEYVKYAYWCYGIPGCNKSTGWYSNPVSKEYLESWKQHVYTFNSDGFDGNFRMLFGYERASNLFLDSIKSYV